MAVEKTRDINAGVLRILEFTSDAVPAASESIEDIPIPIGLGSFAIIRARLVCASTKFTAVVRDVNNVGGVAVRALSEILRIVDGNLDAMVSIIGSEFENPVVPRNGDNTIYIRVKNDDEVNHTGTLYWQFIIMGGAR